MNSYELWRERGNGEVWAMQLLDGVVVGCCGPLALRNRETSYLSSLEYSARRAPWVEAHRDAFDVAAPTLAGPSPRAAAQIRERPDASRACIRNDGDE